MKKIVIVEDDRHLRDTLKDILTMKDFNVYTSIDGVKGYEEIKNINPDLILTDIKMPNMDGIEMVRKIKNEEVLKNIPIIFLSAKTELCNIQEAFEIGAEDYVLKPFELSSILAAINSLLEI